MLKHADPAICAKRPTFTVPSINEVVIKTVESGITTAQSPSKGSAHQYPRTKGLNEANQANRLNKTRSPTTKTRQQIRTKP
jgi:hypothetical protein